MCEFADRVKTQLDINLGIIMCRYRSSMARTSNLINQEMIKLNIEVNDAIKESYKKGIIDGMQAVKDCIIDKKDTAYYHLDSEQRIIIKEIEAYLNGRI